MMQTLKPMDLPPLAANPLVSVLVANYNYGRFLPEALESAREQTYPNLEIIVCDDGSTDDSCEVVQRYARCDDRVKLIRKQNGGVSSALNAAFAEARGDLIALLDADDVWLPQRLARVVHAFRAQPDAGMVTHPLRVIDASGKCVAPRIPIPQLSEGWLAADLLGGCSLIFPAASALTFRLDVAKRILPLPEIIRTLADAALRERAALLGRVAAVEEVLGSYRIHGKNLTGFPTLRTVQEIDEYILGKRRLLQALIEFARAAHGVELQEARGDKEAREMVSVARAFLSGEHLSPKELARRVRGIHRLLFWTTIFTLPNPFARRFYTWWRTRADFLGRPAGEAEEV